MDGIFKINTNLETRRRIGGRPLRYRRRNGQSRIVIRVAQGRVLCRVPSADRRADRLNGGGAIDGKYCRLPVDLILVPQAIRHNPQLHFRALCVWVGVR